MIASRAYHQQGPAAAEARVRDRLAVRSRTATARLTSAEDGGGSAARQARADESGLGESVEELGEGGRNGWGCFKINAGATWHNPR